MNGIDPLDALPVVCPSCSTSGAISLGRIGPAHWFACVACGHEYSLQEWEDHSGILADLARELAWEGFKTFKRNDGMVVCASFMLGSGETMGPLQWRLRELPGGRLQVRKMLDYDRWFDVPERTAAAVVATIEAVEMEDTRRGWPQLPMYHVTHILRGEVGK